MKRATAIARKERHNQGKLDKRFEHARKDPRFGFVARHSKVELDSRFKSMLSDPVFASASASETKVDEYGRPKELVAELEGEEGHRALLKHFYATEKGAEAEEQKQDEENEKEEEGDDDQKEEEKEEKEEKEGKEEDDGQKGEDKEAEADEEEKEQEKKEEAKLTDKKVVMEEDDETDIYGRTATERLEEQAAVPLGEPTSRLAIVDCDWSHVKAVDILAVLQSFVPQGGAIIKVTVYPSNFGLEQLKQEQEQGPPPELWHKDSKDNAGEGEEAEEKEEEEEAEENEEGTGDKDDEAIGFNVEKLRQYELSKLKYFYALVECDSVRTADTLFDECDGVEFEKSAVTLDMRFVPDSQTFTNEPRDWATSVPPDYKPPRVYFKAAQETKLQLSWDETPPERQQFLHTNWATRFKEKDIDETQDDDFHAYLASASESEESDEEVAEDDAPIQRSEQDIQTKLDKIRHKYSMLLGAEDEVDGDNQACDKEAVEGDMEMTFTVGLGKKGAELLEKKKEAEEAKDSTAWEKYEQKRRDKDKAKKAEKAQKKVEGEKEAIVISKKAAEERHKAKAERKKKLRLKKQEHKVKGEAADEALDTSDPRFVELFTSPNFAPDPTVPQFKQSKGMQKILEVRSKRMASIAAEDLQQRSAAVTTATPTPAASSSSLADLVSSVKQKAAQQTKRRRLG
eukprot:TRINITY_DN5639_c0_g1_i2.p1 TRINITY_DN5639_c0_g1~~TRINITY_DN5639_c0_g1_i2.p1  ORF type:complete len:684 (-),score=272.74 TRINITY_DN5639_c0_g1_i2:73-2124(-)